MTRRLEGRIALVVGGGSGMGRATSIRLAEEGAHVYRRGPLRGRRQRRAEEIAAAGGSAEGVRLDATDNDALRALFARIDAEHGKLHVLHNQVGMPGAGGLDVSEADFDRAIDVNVKQAFYVASLGYELVKKADRKGSITMTALDRGAGRLAVQPALLADQGRAHGVHPGARAGRRTGRRAGQRDLPRPGRHPDAPDVLRPRPRARTWPT